MSFPKKAANGVALPLTKRAKVNDALLIVAAGAVIAGFVQGLTGFAFGLTSLAFWAWVLEPRIAGPLVVLSSLVGHVFSLPRVLRAFDVRRILPMLAGGVVGVPFGAMLLKHVDAETFKIGIGALLVVYCPTALLSHKVSAIERAGAAADAAIGAVSGVIGGMSGLSAIISTLWCTLRGWDRDAQRAAFQSFAFAMQIVTVAAYAVTGVFSRELFRDFAVAAPCIIVPAFLGGRLYTHFSPVAFRRVVLSLLTVSGAVLLVSAFKG